MGKPRHTSNEIQSENHRLIQTHSQTKTMNGPGAQLKENLMMRCALPTLSKSMISWITIKVKLLSNVCQILKDIICLLLILI